MRFGDLLLRLRALLFSREMDQELQEELQFHLEMQARKNLSRAFDPVEAKRQARLQFGSVERTTEECREARGVNFLETLAHDVRYALRGFRRSPVFAGTVIAVIAVGLGINTAVFTIFDAYVLRPVAVRDPDSLYRLRWTDRRGNDHLFTWKQFEELTRDKDQRVLSDPITERFVMARIETRPMFGRLVTGNFFQALGVGAQHGRTLVPADSSAPGSSPVLVLSHQAWQHQFGGDPAIIGKKLLVRGYPIEVVGVTPPQFTGLGEVPIDFWVPITLADRLEDGPSLFNSDSAKELSVIGRLTSNTGKREAEAKLTSWIQRMTAELPIKERAVSATLVPEGTPIPLTPEILTVFSPILFAFGLVLLIACANIANLMLARAMSRQREIGTRLSLGASRFRLVRQLLTESIVLALPAAALGFLISQAVLEYGQRLMFATLPADFARFIRVMPLHADARVFGFMVIAAVAAAIFFGLAPALQVTRANVMQACKGEFTTDHRPARLRNALVIGQLTMCVLLLSCSMLLLHSARDLSRVVPGVKTGGVLELEFPQKYASALVSQLRAHPLVEKVAAAQSIPLNGVPAGLTIETPENRKSRDAWYNLVTPEFFTVLQIPILRGRTFTAAETEAQAPVVIVSSATAEKLWPGRDPLGQVIHVSSAERDSVLHKYDNARVIAVAGDIFTTSIAWGKDPTMLYYPAPAGGPARMLLMNVRGDDQRAVEVLDASLEAAIPGAVMQMHRMQDLWVGEVYPFRAAGWVAACLAGLALWLTVSGVYGVLSYLVAQRSKEIGIRLALGASTRAVASLVLKQSLRLAAFGVGAGTMIAIASTRLIVPQLEIPSLKSFDGPANLFAISVVLLAAAGAAYIPTLRAISVDPVEILRHE